MTTRTRICCLLALFVLAGCRRAPEERAFEACRAEIARRLVDPALATYDGVKVARRSGDGASVVDGWDVHVTVHAPSGKAKMSRSWVRCTLGLGFELLDLTGEEDDPERR
jgi:hypothetical protein